MAKKKKSDQQVDVGSAKEIEQDSNLGTLIEWVDESEDLCQGARELSEKCRDYYDSKQLSAKEIATLKQRKQAPVVINRIKPKMDTLMGMEKAAKTTAKAFPRTPKHESAAEAASEAIRYCLQDNAFDQTRSDVWENILIEGTGGCEIIAKPYGESFKIRIRPIQWDRLIWDPYSRNKYFTDARFLGQVIWMDKEQALVEHPGSEQILESLLESTGTYADKPQWVDTKRQRVKIVELYYYKGKEIYYACFTRGGYLKGPMLCPYKNEEGEHEWPYEFASAFVDRDGNRYGAAKQLLDIQDEINKRRSKALHLMSVRQVRWERGAVDDINKTRQELAKPDGVIETTPGMEFEVLKTGDMAAAQFNLLTEAKMEIDAVGANAATQGKDKSVQSGVALRERQSAGTTEVGPMFDRLRHFQYRVFRKVYNRIRQYWKAEMWIRVTDDPNNLRWVGLNKPMTKGEMILQQAQQQGAKPEELQQLQMQIASDPTMQQVVSTQNDIANLDVDIIVSEVPDVLNAQIEDFAMLAEMVKSGFPMPPEAVIEASPLSNKEKIIKLMKAAPQIPPQIQQQMEQLQEQGKKLAEENQVLKSGQQEAAVQAQADVQVAALKAQRAREDAQAEMELKRWVQEQEIALERERAAATLQLERDKALAQAELKLMEISASADADIDGAINKIQGVIMQHEARAQATAEKDKAVAEAGEKASGEKAAADSSAQIRSIGEQIIAALSAKKTKSISLVKRDGQLVGAEVTEQ
jgi:hypothetical protein